VVFQRAILLFVSLLLTVSLRAESAAKPSRPAPVLFISLDGFRSDYCELYPEQTPNLRRLRAEGASARALIPVFPSNTFPTHYSIATGLLPSHHGIINNRFFDPTVGRFFHYNQAAANHDAFWWGGEPVWITAVRQGRASACYFWPGSETTIQGRRPTFWKPYNYSVPFTQRLAELISWLKLPADQQPAVIAFYLEEANSVGHRSGPGSPELGRTLQILDAQVGAIINEASTNNIPLNLVVLSDHGMAARQREQVVIIDDYIDLTSVQVDFDGPVAGLRPNDGNTAALLAKLSKMPPQVHALAKESLPKHLGLSDNPRLPPVWILADEGWLIQRRSQFDFYRDTPQNGEHGYDPTLTSMQGILIVHGPAFRKDGATTEPAECIHIYNLLCAAAGLNPAPNDGDDRLVRAFLVQ
jgi:predicted AlkP superfamily pyrophosphatase or phosphodiesterase